MKREKRGLTLMALVLLCAMVVSVAAVNPAGAAFTRPGVDPGDIPEPPVVTIESNLVTGGGFLELSVYVSAKEFTTVGAVLSYDTTALQPVDWTTGADEDISGSKSWDDPAVLYTKGSDILAGKPALAYTEYNESDTATGRANIYLGASSLEYTNLLNERVVTVRFKIKDGATLDFPTASPTDSGTVQLAATGVARAAIPNNEVYLTCKDQDYSYSAMEDAAVEAKMKRCDVKFTEVEKESINKGGSSVVSGDYVITFFDWDGRVIDAIAAPKNAEATVNTWKAPLLPKGERLNNKPGYEFDQWLVVYENNDGKGLQTLGGTFTSNDTALNANTNPDVAQLGDISGYTSKKDPTSKAVLLQAAYRAKTTANGDTEDLVNDGLGTAAAARYYTVKPIKYTRYGGATSNDGKYSITLEVTRLNSADKGVTRARTPGVVVKMQPTAAGSQPIFTLLSLENTDTVTCEMVPNKQISSVEYYFIDAATSPGNWPGAGVLSLQEEPLPKDGPTGFVRLGTVGYINDMARQKETLAEFIAVVDSQTFTDAGLTYSNIATAQSKLYTAVRASATDLNQTQLQTAINS